MCLSLILSFNSPPASRLYRSRWLSPLAARYPHQIRAWCFSHHGSLTRFSHSCPYYRRHRLLTRNQSCTQQQMALTQHRITNTKSILDLAIIFQFGLHVASVLFFLARLVLKSAIRFCCCCCCCSYCRCCRRYRLYRCCMTLFSLVIFAIVCRVFTRHPVISFAMPSVNDRYEKLGQTNHISPNRLQHTHTHTHHRHTPYTYAHTKLRNAGKNMQLIPRLLHLLI